MVLALLGGVSAGAWAVSAGDKFTRISAISELSDGDEIIFVNQAETYACGTTQNTNNRTPVSITVSDHSYTYASSDNVQVFVVKKSGNNYGFHTGSGYIYSAATNSNNLKTNTTAASTAPSGTAAWTLSVSSNVFSVTNVSNTSYYLAFNGTSYFSQYKTGQSKPYIFKKQATPTAEITMTSTDVDLAVGATNTRTASSSTTGATISYSSSNSSVASVNASTGEVTAVSEGSATITATASADGYLDATASYTVNVSDARTAVNLSTFTATSTTLIKGGTTTTSVTNDQAGWTAAYTYSSDNEDVATVNASGVVTAVAKGTATITCSLNVDAEDEDYKAGTTTSKTIDITVNNPSHTATFNVNGKITSDTFEEGDDIDFPSDPDDIDGKVFCGWVDAPIAGTTNSTPSFVASPTMGTSDVTYYAVFATAVAGSEQNATKTITTSTTNFPTSYGTAKTFTQYTLEGVKFKIQQAYINSGKLQWRSGTDSTNGGGIMYNTDALSKLQSIVITYNGDNNKNFTVKVGDTENPTSGTSITPTNDGENTYTYDCSSYNKSYFVLANGDKAGYLSSIAITYKVTGPTTYTKYCTTVSGLPEAVVTLSTDAIEMTWGETGKTLTATATVNEEELDETITYTSSSANLTINSSTGAITCNVPGDYTITASVAATAEHQAGEAICNVTVNKKDIELEFANETVNKMTTDESYTQTATVTPGAYDGDITYEITSSSSVDAIIDEDTGELLFENTGVIEVTATAAATTLYNGNTATYTLYVKTTPTIVVSNQSVAYGSTFTVDDSAIEGGDITVTSGSATIATVDGLVITPVAVGSTTITVSTAASDTYIAGEETFTLTVTAPIAATSSTEAKRTVFYESFDTNESTGGNDGTWSGSAGGGAWKADNTWVRNSYTYGASHCVRISSGNNPGSITTPSISTTSGVEYTLTFKAGSWAGKSSTLSISATGATSLSLTSQALTNETFNNYSATFTATGSSATITFSSAKDNALFLDEVRVTTPVTSTSVTTTGGIATYCYQYPLDLDGIEGAKAYKVSEVDTEKKKLMMTQITGTIKGGVPFILKSDDGDDDEFEIPLAASSSTVPASNALVGTLAPTFVAQTSGDYTNFAYSKSKKCFVKLGDAGNTVPANRAYLPINLGSGEVKAFTLFFDDTATGIRSIDNGQFRDLQPRWSEDESSAEGCEHREW